MLAICTRCSEH